MLTVAVLAWANTTHILNKNCSNLVYYCFIFALFMFKCYKWCSSVSWSLCTNRFEYLRGTSRLHKSAAAKCSGYLAEWLTSTSSRMCLAPDYRWTFHLHTHTSLSISGFLLLSGSVICSIIKSLSQIKWISRANWNIIWPTNDRESLNSDRKIFKCSYVYLSFEPLRST